MYVHLACPHLLFFYGTNCRTGKSDTIFLQLEMMGNPVDLFNQSGLLQLLLVGGDWNIFDCSIQLGIIIPTDYIISFRGVGIPPTRLWLWLHERHIKWVVNGWFHLFLSPIAANPWLPGQKQRVGTQAPGTAFVSQKTGPVEWGKRHDMGSMDVFWG